jgi:hypothetical protein
MSVRTGVWLGIGMAIAIAAMPPPLKAQVQSPPPPAAANAPAALPGDLAFGRFIALIRGHLLTGDELVKRRDWSAAYPHFTFPTEEIYGVIRDELHTYKTPPFDAALKALARSVKARNAARYPKALEKVEAALNAADAGLKAKVSNWPRFKVAVAIEVLKTAPDEYDDAIANGRVVHPVGYRTTRGFILQAERMIESVSGDLEGKNPAALQEIRASFAQLKQVFPSTTAPKTPIEDYNGVAGMVSSIELAAGKLM